MSKPKIGQSLVLSSLLAILSYLPFEVLAKSTLIFCILTFVTDPFPPTWRLLSIVGALIVYLLNKLYRDWKEGQFLHGIDDSLELKEEKQHPDDKKRKLK
jgi:hypothetical protein